MGLCPIISDLDEKIWGQYQIMIKYVIVLSHVSQPNAHLIFVLSIYFCAVIISS